MATNEEENQQVLSHNLSDGREVTSGFVEALEAFVLTCSQYSHDNGHCIKKRSDAKRKLFHVMMGEV